ncbi:phosphatase [Actinoplanes sp. SE50]|uniref:phosphatase PAP2 family protein n=1 Tax=unclassified Actinoplanes TaxID=2626549 RepID=UPI00023EDF82|nr:MULTISPECIES: phosphatase PAP2 family protein [unclassified Actinoplanes]AEV88884.1 phosphoesterase PA-phosphatase related protein [Actinoplanes sp. SE50/110]ATO87290.1 phosphatase [Actinoplanes sp. SE50]SLM04708.1 phosphatase [Actinoplanes sp. SE50/110]
MIRRRILSWWPDLLLLAAFAALTGALITGHLLTLDQRVADWAFDHQPAVPYWTARVFNYLGQGGKVLTPVALILTGLLAHRTRSVRALLPFIAAYVVTYVTIGPMKLYFDRAAPSYPGPFKTEMFNPVASGQDARSFPSGHVGNSLVWYAVFAILIAELLRRRLTRRESFAIRVLPVAAVFVTTVYTGFHWLTDSLAGLLLGLVLARLIERIPWDDIPLPAAGGWSRPAFRDSAVRG